MIKDQNGEEMKAIDIYAFAIKYLNKQVIRKLNTWEGGRWNVQTQDGHYVLTVPATWDDQAHIFMRKAAEQVCKVYKLCLISRSYITLINDVKYMLTL